MKLSLTITVLFVLSSFFGSVKNSSFSQPVEQWVSRYNGTGDGEDYITDLIVDGTGNVYVTGYSWGNGTENDFTTIKYNSTGTILWVKRHNGLGNGDDRSNAIVLDDSGNVYVTGSSTGIGTYGDFFTIKYNSSGDTIWTRSWDSDFHQGDGAQDIELDPFGNIYVTGSSYRGGNAWDCVTIKYNSSGVEQWASLYSGQLGDFDLASSLAVDNSGNAYVTGRCGANGSGEYLTIKYDSDGDTLWTRKYDGPANGVDEADAIVLDESGNVYVTGRSLGNTSGYDYATIKYNPSGDTLWIRRYNGTANDIDEAYAIAVDVLGNVYVTGESNGAGTSIDYLTIKYNSSGDVIWTQRYNGPEFAWDIAYSITVDDLGNAYVTGESNGGSPGYIDYATVKYNASGIEQWVKRYNGPVNSGDYGKRIAVDDSGNVYVAGYSPGNEFNYDFVTIKYSENVTSINEYGIGLPENYFLFQNFPNPFNPSTTISFSIPNEEFVTLKVFNSLGEEVAELINETKAAGNYSVSFDANSHSGNVRDLTSGVYFYKISAGNFNETKKMIFLK